MKGTVYLVGAGPGAPDLLTVRAARRVPVGKRSGRHSTAQRFINKRLADAARRYRVVARLKGGDPMLFGRAHEEISFLRKNSIKVEIVPGITAALAASAELGVYMAAGEGQAVKDPLLGAGLRPGTPVVVAQSVSLPERRLSKGTLKELPALAARGAGGPPSFICASTKVPLRFHANRHMLARMSHPFIREALMGETNEIRVVFDAPPGRNMPTLVTVEDQYGRRITGGEWRARPDGYWELVFRTEATLMQPKMHLN